MALSIDFTFQLWFAICQSKILSLYIYISLQWRHNWRWCLSPASPLFTQPFSQAQIKENIKAPHQWPLCRGEVGQLFIWGPRVGIHRWPMNSPRKWPVTRKMFSFDDVIGNLVICAIRLQNATFHLSSVLSIRGSLYCVVSISYGTYVIYNLCLFVADNAIDLVAMELHCIGFTFPSKIFCMVVWDCVIFCVIYM